MKNDTYYMSSSELSSAISSYDNYLSQVSNQSTLVASSLNDFSVSSSTYLVGDVWDDIRNNLQKYDECLEVSQAVNSFIAATNKECLQTIQEFLEPDSDLNTADLPKFEKERDDLETQISNLQAENAKLSQVPESICVGYDEDGNPIYEHNPAYDAAQEQIAENNRMISEVLTPALNEVNRLINKINDFYNRVLPAVLSKLEESEEKLQEFMNEVDNIMMSGLSFSPRTDGNRACSYDLNTKEGRFLYIYEQLTEKYGYSEWGAKAMLAQMYGTNPTFNSTTKQGENLGYVGPGYGLCQWEWKSLGGCGTADLGSEWCKKNGYDFNTIDGQLAWLDYYLPVRFEAYHDPESYSLFKTGTKDDYEKMVRLFGTYHQGTQGDSNKNYNRAYDGNLLYKLFPLIDEKDSYKVDSSSNMSTLESTNNGISSKVASIATLASTVIPVASAAVSTASSTKPVDTSLNSNTGYTILSSFSTESKTNDNSTYEYNNNLFNTSDYDDTLASIPINTSGVTTKLTDTPVSSSSISYVEDGKTDKKGKFYKDYSVSYDAVLDLNDEINNRIKAIMDKWSFNDSYDFDIFCEENQVTEYEKELLKKVLIARGLLPDEK